MASVSVLHADPIAEILHAQIIEDQPSEPSILIGHSWGALMALLVAARSPSLVTKLILVSCIPLVEGPGILQTRLDRLEPGLHDEVEELIAHSEEHDAIDRLDEIFEICDSYDPLPHKHAPVRVTRELCAGLRTLRASGELLRLGGRIRCPVLAIHGDYDPHPADAVREPLAQIVRDFRFVLLPRCGHKPWIERHAREPFFDLLRQEI